MEGPKNKRKKTLASQGSPPQKRGKTNTYSSMKEPKKKK
jgi:hypothetical protein